MFLITILMHLLAITPVNNDPNMDIAKQLHQEREEQHKRDLTQKPQSPSFDADYAHSDAKEFAKPKAEAKVVIPAN